VRATGRAYTPEKTARYETIVGWEARRAMDGRQPLSAPLRVEVTAFMPIPKNGLRKAELADAQRELLCHAKRPDLSNVLKAVEDALNGVVWTDDALISQLVLRKVYSPRPRLEIEVEALGYDRLHTTY
jgi:Holliday junction resolvase RusA-like endonuclease